MNASRTMLRMLPSASLGALVALVAAGCAPDADVDDEMGRMEESEPVPESTVETDVVPILENYDLDDDGALSSDEFAGWLGQADVDAAWTFRTDSDLDLDRVAERMIVVWDVENDSVVSEEEWVAGVRTWYGPDDYGAFVDWDADGDSELDANEIAEALETRGMYDRVDLDRDAVIDDEELADWFFDVIDTSDDGQIDTTEWDAAMEYDWLG